MPCSSFSSARALQDVLDEYDIAFRPMPVYDTHIIPSSAVHIPEVHVIPSTVCTFCKKSHFPVGELEAAAAEFASTSFSQCSAVLIIY